MSFVWGFLFGVACCSMVVLGVCVWDWCWDAGGDLLSLVWQVLYGDPKCVIY